MSKNVARRAARGGRIGHAAGNPAPASRARTTMADTKKMPAKDAGGKPKT
jgi:hypothetical protein